ncbi:hypothetical protein [Nostoc sp.]|uniref:hypothetical protein n=1 Tax=Nostoc sp. TaxID=1180 RepID=UPI002FF9C0FA
METEFYSKIQAIRDELRRQLVTACGENETQSSLDNLCTPLSNFNSRLLESLKSYIDTISRPDSQDWQQLTEILDNISEQKESELTEFQKIVDTESLPRLLRDIKIDYLDYLRIECAKTSLHNSNAQGFACLETLIKRLRLLINYINDPDLDDPDYEVSYLLDKPVNHWKSYLWIKANKPEFFSTSLQAVL